MYVLEAEKVIGTEVLVWWVSRFIRVRDALHWTAPTMQFLKPSLVFCTLYYHPTWYYSCHLESVTSPLFVLLQCLILTDKPSWMKCGLYRTSESLADRHWCESLPHAVLPDLRSDRAMMWCMAVGIVLSEDAQLACNSLLFVGLPT